MVTTPVAFSPILGVQGAEDPDVSPEADTPTLHVPGVPGE